MDGSLLDQGSDMTMDGRLLYQGFDMTMDEGVDRGGWG